MYRLSLGIASDRFDSTLNFSIYREIDDLLNRSTRTSWLKTEQAIWMGKREPTDQSYDLEAPFICQMTVLQVSGNWNAYEMNGFVEGATFESIVHYVLKNMKITQARAGYLVMEVLKAGVSLGRIKKTPRGTYILATDKPGSITHNIKEPHFSDDSDYDVSSEDSS